MRQDGISAREGQRGELLSRSVFCHPPSAVDRRSRIHRDILALDIELGAGSDAGSGSEGRGSGEPYLG